ncbi:MAG TPA: DUF2585 family protein [Tepidisphaeraceae bacterium]|nr:DUF2585 family protein [Tepidisphaeraceae bacterium]
MLSKRFIPIQLPRSAISSPTFVALSALGILLIAAIVEHAMGRVFFCKCGHVRFWGAMNSPELSQQVADWYSFSHIIHGMALYGLLHLVSRGKSSVGKCFLLMMAIEASWEMLENSPIIIDRYRHSTMSLDYYGDSILNSMSDILFAAMGFGLAAYLPVWVVVAMIVLMEVGVGYAIRDNLTLNIIMLIHPFQAIKHWQMGAG